MVHDDIRRRLIDAAAEVFAERGYDGARVQQIAERANLTTGAIYNRFSGKSELLLEAADHHSEDLLPMLLDAELRTADVLAAAAAALVDSKPTLGRALLHELFLSARREPELADKLRPRLVESNDRLARLISEDQSAGLIHPEVDVAAMAVFCQAVGLGVDILQIIGVDLPSPDEWQRVVDLLISAVVPEVTDATESAEEM